MSKRFLRRNNEKLRKLFERHAEHQTVVDLSGADPFLSMLLGCAMGNRPDRMLETVFYDIREGGFYPKVRRRRWIRNEMPQLSLEELRYLQYGQAERVSEADLVYGRNDLTPELVREAPALTEMVAKDRAFWLETAERIRADIPADASSFWIRLQQDCASRIWPSWKSRGSSRRTVS